ncbi:unnamed protein product [Cylicocyclus nassatus]|uniref:VWFA domain-containing protein n=1 Tax=Cylicocyclus nassatus TaxID=53992 RepID=A0AA36HFW0_CYLNA|nr:unnamed protein product [Cylicocyclus nassatus]
MMLGPKSFQICKKTFLFTGVGPPGVQPPPSFKAEDWYPSNLPTVKPPRRSKGLETTQIPVSDITTVNGNGIVPSSFTSASPSTGDGTTTTQLPELTTATALMTVIDNDETVKDPANGTNLVSEDVVLESSTEAEEGISSSAEVPPSLEEESTTFVSSSTTVKRGADDDSRSSKIKSEFKNNKVSSDVTTLSPDHEETTAPGIMGCTDIFFVLDSSGNVLEQYENQKLLIGDILIELGEAERQYGLMTYAGRTRQRINVSPRSHLSKSLFAKKVASAPFLSGITATGSALKTLANLNFVRSTDVVVVTDGFSFDRVQEGSQLLRAVAGIRVFVAGNYTPVLLDVLTSITGDSTRVLVGKKSIPQLVKLLQC